MVLSGNSLGESAYSSSSQKLVSGLLGVPETLRGGLQGKTIFIIVLSCYLSFSLSFSDKTHSLEFSRSYMTCDVTTE